MLYAVSLAVTVNELLNIYDQEFTKNMETTQ